MGNLTLSPQTFDTIKKRVEAATRGPWVSDEEDPLIIVDGQGQPLFIIDPRWIGDNYVTLSDQDRDFILNARQDMQLLISEIERIRNLVEELENRLESAQAVINNPEIFGLGDS